MLAGGSQETLRLEGFAENLKGNRIYCVSADAKEAEKLLKGQMASLNTEVAHRGRKVLVFQGASAPVPKWLMSLSGGWDAVFHVKDASDLKMVVTYVQYATRPIRIVWAGGEPAGAVLTAMEKVEGTTILGLGEKAPVSGDWNVVMWGSGVAIEEVERGVVGRMGAGGARNLRPLLKELRGSELALVWSCIGRSDKYGSLYWVDPTEGVEPDAIDLKEAALMLKGVARMLEGGGL
jgi:hypothetical protein